MYYRGKGEHSVSELEQIIFELKEKEHLTNAPYIESCLTRLENLRVNSDEQLYDYNFIKRYLEGIKNNTDKIVSITDVEMTVLNTVNARIVELNKKLDNQETINTKFITEEVKDLIEFKSRLIKIM